MITDDFTAQEIAAAYRRARLRYQGITLFKALTTPVIYQSLCHMAEVARKQEQQQHGQPAPMQRAA